MRKPKIMYDFTTIKFRLNKKTFNKTLFTKVVNSLNISFDENYNPYINKNENYFEFKDFTGTDDEIIENEIDSFFKFNFYSFVDICLYKFLVLKSNDNYIILGNVNSLIFDYTSINNLSTLLDASNDKSFENHILKYYRELDNYLSSSDFKKSYSHWQREFMGMEKYLKFYNVETDNYKSKKIKIDFEKLKITDKFNLITSVFSLYLSRINNSKGCLLKTKIMNQTNDLGPFDKSILLKLDYEKDISFSEYANAVKRAYDKVSKNSKVDMEHYSDYHPYYSIYDFSKFENIDIYNGFGCALTLNIYNNHLELIYNCDLFSDIYINHMLDNIASMINNVAESPNQFLKDINILSKNEEAMLFDFCRGDDFEMDEDRIFSIGFRENAKINSENIAIDDGMNKITFKELEKSSNSIAYDLRENFNITSGNRVGIIITRNYHFLELVLALNKIGAIFIPIDPSYPISRVKSMMDICKTNVAITSREVDEEYDFIDLIFIEDLNRDLEVDIDIEDNDIFSIMFTSGTMGVPKAVMISNRQCVLTASSLQRLLHFSNGDMVGSFLPFSFVGSFIMYAALYFGAGCRIFNEIEQKDSLLLMKILKTTPMNNVMLSPMLGTLILETPDLKLDYMIMGGAKLIELTNNKSNTKVVNLYGTTEIIAGIAKIYNSEDIKNKSLSIGKPLFNTWVYILDEDCNQMPIGVPGEICISYKYMSPGYCNSADLTSAVFVDNPISYCDDNKILYRTGDIGFYNFNGEIEFVGREDEQLSVRGFRVESDEILTIMKGFKEISDVFLDVDYDTLIAYYVTNGHFNVDNIKNSLKNYLPNYMVPSLFVEVQEIPLNPNGKVNKFELKDIVKDNPEIKISDEILSTVMDGFKSILNSDVRIDSDFVSLGGNSLSAMKLQSYLKEKLDISLSSNEIIELSTPINVSNHIKSNLNMQTSFESKYTFDDFCPLSESQLNIYLDETTHNLGTVYNNPFKIEFKKKYSIDFINEIINKYLEAYPILSAHILSDNGNIFFRFNSKPTIENGNEENFVRPFDLNENLARFSIVENDKTTSLYIDLHHLIFDVNSLNVLIKNLNVIMGECDEFKVDDGVLRQTSFEEQMLNSGYIDNAKNFFDSMLDDYDETYPLMASINSKDSGEINSYLEFDSDKLNMFLRKNSITHNQFFTSIFAYTLSRFTGSSKVLFNLLEDGRGHVDLTDSIGMFMRTLPILIDCENKSVESFLKNSAKLINSAMKYDMYPFRILANKYDLDSKIIFEYLPNILKNYDMFSVEELKHDKNHDLFFSVNNYGANEFIINASYSSKFSQEFIISFVDVYKRIVSDILNVELLSDINYISKSDLEFLDDLNHTDADIKYNDILDAFNNNLAKYPENKLVSYNDINYTYSEGAFIASFIADNLKKIGISSGDCVSFLLNRSHWYLLSILGIMSVGSVFVPLDSKHPDEHLKFVVDDTSSKLVIVDNDTYERAKKLFGDLPILNVSGINVSGNLTKLPVTYNDLACILYTSGTTGLPKGVKNTRKSILNVCAYYTEKYGLDHEDTYGLFSAIGFDVSIFVINVVIYAGACLSVVPNEIRFDLYKMNEYFISQCVSHTFMTTQVAKLFMKSVNCDYLDVLLVIGEKLGEVETPANYSLIDAYGPTEAFAFVTSIENNKKIDSSSVGLVDYNMKSYILDDELRQVPIGGVGELYLSGYQIADGYLNRDEETKSAFLDNPFDEGIMYRTGDLVRILPDGTIGFISRRDSQIKIRGNRLELGEVEAIIRQLDYIDDVTVQTIKNGENNELVAYVVCSKEHNDSIKEYISQKKPDYMIPSHIINLDEIPLNINGKVDKKALNGLEFNNSNANYIMPKTDLEKTIVNAFENAFNKTQISLRDDFAKLGGDSLIAIKLISYLKEYNVSAADIMSLRTPKAIADDIKINSFDLDIYSLDTGCPLKESQLNIYLDIMTKKEVDSYFIPFITDIPKDLGENEIIKILNKMFEIHPICSMCICDELETPYLIKSRTPSISIASHIDDMFIYRFLTKPFDVHDSLCRFLIVENDEKYLLYSVFHHLIFDERSIHVFQNDFKRIINGDSIDLDDSFLKVSAFNTQVKDTTEYDDAHDFYNSMLSDNEGIGVILDDVLPDGPNFISIDLNFDNDIIDNFLKENAISEYVLFTSVFAYTLSRFTGSSKVLFYIDDHGRDRFDNFDSIGMFVNTIPILLQTNDDEISSFVKKVSDLIYNVLRYDYYSYNDLIDEQKFYVNILFQYFPIWLNREDSFHNADNNIIKNINDFNTDLIFTVNQKPNGCTLNVQYSAKYSGQTIKRFLDVYNSILSQITNVRKLSDINYVSTHDLDLLDKYNQGDNIEIKYENILEAFNDNLAKCPDNKLVSYNDISYTYGEGAFIASEIAKCLKNAGIESGDFVPFLVPRSTWYLLLFLGILSCGALYVPLDEVHPDERLKFILNDLNSKIIVVTDETYARAKELSDDLIIINVSDIIEGKVGTLPYLEYEYNELASVFYTSGSTGIPKGVLGTKKAIVNLCQYYVDNYPLTCDDAYGLHTSIGFDVSIFVIAVAIYVGASLSVIPEDIRLNMFKLNEYFTKHNITHSFITTQVGKLFIKIVDESSLDFLFVIGEKLGEIESPKNYKLIDSYGPTETFNFVSAIDNARKIDYSSIGSLVYNMKAYILDEELRQIPIGAVGELYLSGRQIANGYLNRSEETSNAFIDNPFGEGMMYRTGDMVRILPDGSLGIIGRKDSQVKIRGNRVELSEVESVIYELSYIKDVTVQTINNDGNNELIAFIVNKEDVPIVKSVKDHVGERKPEYMIPSFVIELDEIPLNVNGKIDKKALLDIDLDISPEEYVAPVSETEKTVVDAFKSVFNIDKIGIYDDFIKLGGNSLTAIKITTFLSKYNIEFNARDIIVERTPYRIAQIIDFGNCNNFCKLIKKGDANQNMFLIPPMTGFSFEYSNLVHSFNFKGNVYAIDDPKFKLSHGEIKKLEHHDQYTLDEYYEMIKETVNDGDILTGFSSGGIYALLLAEKLEKDEKIVKCILIDGLLSFKEVLYTREKFYNDALANWRFHEFDFIVGTDRKGSKFEKFVEITLLNVNNNFDEPHLNGPILYLSTGELYSEDELQKKLNSISSNNEIHLIESTNHYDILRVDYYKLIPFFD